jgi:hypothetical protein
MTTLRVQRAEAVMAGDLVAEAMDAVQHFEQAANDAALVLAAALALLPLFPALVAIGLTLTFAGVVLAEAEERGLPQLGITHRRGRLPADHLIGNADDLSPVASRDPDDAGVVTRRELRGSRRQDRDREEGAVQRNLSHDQTSEGVGRCGVSPLRKIAWINSGGGIRQVAADVRLVRDRTAPAGD